MGRILRVIPATALAILFLAACASPPDADTPCADGGEQWSEYRLFLGRSAGGAEVVSDADWDAFLADTVTPRFPDGLSAFDAAGQWRGPDGAIERERSKTLLIFAPTDTGAGQKITEISGEYKRRFGQESVLLAVTTPCVSFD